MRIKFTALTVLFFITQISLGQNFKFGKVSKEELQEKSHQIEPDANAAILYREVITKFIYTEQEGFIVNNDVFERIKIYKKEGFEWATKELDRYQGRNNNRESIDGLKGVTYYLSESGKIQEVKLKKNGIFEERASKFKEVTKFTMPDLKEGCILEYKYTLKSPFVSNIETYRFQESIPINKLDFKFAAPEFYNYKTHVKGWVPFKIDTDTKERSIPLSHENKTFAFGNRESRGDLQYLKYRENSHSVNLNNMPSITEETFVGNIDNYSSSLKMELSYTKFPNSLIKYYAETWEDVSKSIYLLESFGGQLKKTNYFDDELDALLAGISNPKEKMIRVFEFVKKRMTWNEYNGYSKDLGVRSAYKEGKGNAGDINLMLTAMFRYAGLNASPILVSTKRHGIPLYPTREGFNYVIAGVEVQDDVLLFDATNKDGEINILETKLLNWRGRIIRKEGSSAWVDLVPKKHAVQNTLLSVNILEDYTVKGSSQNRFTGHYSMEKRDKYLNTNEDSKRKILEKNKGETEVSNIEFENLTTLNKPIKLSYDFENFDAVEEIEEKLYFSPLLFLAIAENPFKSDERNYPIDYKYSQKDRYLVTINIPEGYVVESIPESTSFGLEQGMGSFKYSISNNGNKIQLSVEMSINEAVIPANAYGGLKKYYQLLIDKENEKVVLSKT